jgi:hypothetical protein
MFSSAHILVGPRFIEARWDLGIFPYDPIFSAALFLLARDWTFLIPDGNRRGVLSMIRKIFFANPKSAYPEIRRAQTPTEWEKWAKGAVLLGSVLLLLAAGWTGVIPKIFRIIPNVPLGNVWFWSLAIYALIHYAAMVWRICLWLTYRPLAPVDESELPSVSVVIPAFNEGPLVRQAIASVARSDYPPHKLQVIAVDDGSKDDTWEHICSASSEAPIPVTTLRQPSNRGKRHALYAGFRKAVGEVWVTVANRSGRRQCESPEPKRQPFHPVSEGLLHPLFCVLPRLSDPDPGAADDPRGSFDIPRLGGETRFAEMDEPDIPGGSLPHGGRSVDDQPHLLPGLPFVFSIHLRGLGQDALNV